MTNIDLTSRTEPILTAKTVSPLSPGHAVAQAWYACLLERLSTEEERQGVRSTVRSNIVPVFEGLVPAAQRDFIDALGALVTDFLVMGEPYAGRWDPKESIEEAIVSEQVGAAE